MLNPLVQKFPRWFLVVLLATILQCCGSLTHSANDSLGVHLQLPEGEDSALFWYGVTQKNLTVTPEEGDPTTIPWVEGQGQGMDLHQGDRLSFSGSDSGGQVLVRGETTVSEENNATIPLRRVL